MSIYGYFSERNYAVDFPYTDLACERRKADVDTPGVSYRREESVGGNWERVRISTAEGARSIGKPMGLYDTLGTSRMDLIDRDGIDDAIDEVARELCHLCEVCDILPERLLVVGLGNPALTPDAVGCECARRVKATMHIKDFDKRLFDTLECSEIAVCTPGVRAYSGMDASTTVMGLCNMLAPDAVIVVDALAARSVERLGSTIQFSTTGIWPGSGVGNSSVPLTERTLGAPTIAIGVPTVIDSRMFWYDAASDGHNASYAGPSMFVSPKEICEIVEVAGEIIAGGINQAFGLYSA